MIQNFRDIHDIHVGDAKSLTYTSTVINLSLRRGVKSDETNINYK